MAPSTRLARSALNCLALAIFAGALYLAWLPAAHSQSSVIERTPSITISRISVAAGGVSHEVTPYAGGSEPAMFAHPHGGPATIQVRVVATVRDVADFAMILATPAGPVEMTASATNGSATTYEAHFTSPSGVVTGFEVLPRYRPIVEPPQGVAFVDEDGVVDLFFAGGVANELAPGNSCEGALRSYFRGHRAAQVIVDVLQEAAAVSAGMAIDIAALGPTARLASRATTAARAFAARAAASAGVDYVRTLVGQVIRGNPMFAHWRGDLVSAFTNGLLDASLQRTLAGLNSRVLQWFEHAHLEETTAASRFVQFLASQEINLANDAGHAMFEALGEEFVDELLLEFRSQRARLGLSADFFLRLGDDAEINGYRLQLAGLQWTVTGRGSIAVNCTPPGASQPTELFLVTFADREGPGNREIAVQRFNASSGHSHEIADLVDLDSAIADVAAAADRQIGDGPIAADDRGTLGEDWRAARRSGPHMVFVGTSLPASAVPDGAPWRIELTGLWPEDEARPRLPVWDVLEQRDMVGEVRVAAGVGGAWMPISQAPLTLAIGGATRHLLSDEDGRAGFDLGIGDGPAALAPTIALANQTQAEPLEIVVSVYDYVLSDIRTAPQDGVAQASGDDPVVITANLRRRTIGPDGTIQLGQPIGFERDFTTIGVTVHGSAMLAADAAAPDRAERLSLEPSASSPITLSATSEHPGESTIRFFLEGGYYARRLEELGTATIRFEPHPLDVALAFGPDMDPYRQPDGSYRIADVPVDGTQPIELDVRVTSTHAGDAGAPRADVTVTIAPEGTAEVSILGERPVSDEDGILRRDGADRPAVWRPAEGPQTIVLSAPGAQDDLVLTIVGIDERESFGLSLEADPNPALLDVESGPVAVRLAGTLTVPEGARFDRSDPTHSLWLAVDSAAGLEIDAEHRLLPPDLSQDGRERTAMILPVVDENGQGRFSGTITVYEAGSIRISAYVLGDDGTEDEVVVSLAVQDGPQIARLDEARIHTCSAVDVTVIPAEELPVGAWIGLFPTSAPHPPNGRPPPSLGTDQRAEETLASARIYAPFEPGDYQLRLYAPANSEPIDRLALSVWPGDPDRMVSGAEDCLPLIAGRWEGTSRIESAAGAGPQADLAFTVAPRDGDSGVPGLRGDYAIIDQVPPPPDGDYGYTMLCDRRGNDLLCEALFFSEGCGSAPYARLPADWTIAPDGSTLSRQQIVDTIVDPSRCTVRPMAETVRGANMPDHVVVTTIMHRTEQ